MTKTNTPWVLLALILALAGCTASGQPAPGQSWIIDSMIVYGERFDLSGAKPLTLEIRPDGQVGGSSGCNSTFGSMEFKEDGSLVSQDFSATEMACETGMDVEAAYLSALGSVETYEYSEYELTLKSSDGLTVLVFQLLQTD